MDPNQAFMYKVIAGLTQKYLYDMGMIKTPPDYHKLVGNLKKMGPVGVSAPPALQGGFDYLYNEEWWSGDTMYKENEGKIFPWPDSKVEGMNDPNVSQLAKTLGNITGLSPKRLEGAAKNVFPVNNEFVYMFGKAYEGVFADVPDDLKKDHWMITLARTPLFSKVIGISRPGYTMGEFGEQLTEADDINDVVRDGNFEAQAKQYAWYGVGTRDNIIQMIKDEARKDLEVVDPWINKLVFLEGTANLKHRSTWLRAFGYDPDVKGQWVIKVFDSATDKERNELIDELGTVMSIRGSGFDSDAFYLAVGDYWQKTGRGLDELPDIFKKAPASVR